MPDAFPLRNVLFRGLKIWEQEEDQRANFYQIVADELQGIDDGVQEPVCAEADFVLITHFVAITGLNPANFNVWVADPFPGGDSVEFLLAPHRGVPPGPLREIASGGELSRVMLAVEVVFSGADPVPTLVFDEVDAGVGGEAALAVGRSLAELGQRHQVLVVTHLAQVAAFADAQVVVRKETRSGRTVAAVRAVCGDERVQELSRMLSGLADSGSANVHARELLQAATARRKG
jgi:DNA repair ATPase RecN